MVLVHNNSLCLILWQIWYQKIGHKLHNDRFHIGIALLKAYHTTIKAKIEAWANIRRHKRSGKKNKKNKKIGKTLYEGLDIGWGLCNRLWETRVERGSIGGFLPKEPATFEHQPIHVMRHDEENDEEEVV